MSLNDHRNIPGRDLVANASLAVDSEQQLLGLIDERNPVFQGLGTARVNHIRGAALLALGRRGALGHQALLAVLEELDTGRAAYPVAAAAKALGASPPAPAHAALLVGSLRRLRDANDYVQLDRWGGEPTAGDDPPTARAIVLGALIRQAGALSASADALEAWWTDEGHTLTQEEEELARQLRAANFGRAPDCCDLEGPLHALARRARHLIRTTTLKQVRLENQDGQQYGYDDVFIGAPGVIAFFYTRCDNPDKCSLTVARLAELQRRLAERGDSDRLRITAITYDPAFDDAPRLAAYGSVRGFRPGPGHQLLRAVAGWDALQAHFELGVGYLHGVVNRHRIELCIHDAQGQVVFSHERLRWSVDEILHQVGPMLRASVLKPLRDAHPSRFVDASARAMGPAILAALAVFPKCPICGVAYLSMAGMTVLPTLPGPYLWLPVLLGMLCFHLALLGWLAWRGNHWSPLVWSTVGSATALIGGLGFQRDLALWGGLAVVGIGSLATLLQTGKASRALATSHRPRAPSQAVG